MAAPDWVEIKEPDTHKVVYANPKTGIMQYTPPNGEQYKPMSDNQWWELLDSNSSSYYYHNPHTGQTVWEKPENADIISLTLMQKHVTPGSNGGGESVNGITQNNGHHHDNIPETDGVESTDHNIVEESVNCTPDRKTSDAFKAPLESLSPFCVEYEGRRFSSLTDDDKSNHNDKKNISILNPTDPVPESKIDQSGVSILQPNSSESSPSLNKTRPTSDTTNMMSEDERKRFESFLVLSMKDINQQNTVTTTPPGATAVPGSPRRTKSEKVKFKNSTVAGSSSGTRKKEPHNRSHSQAAIIPMAPVPPALPMSGMSRSMSLQVQPGKSLEQFNDLATHKIGFFRKKVTIANMLSFTKDPIKQPMILQRDKELKKDSIALFKLVLEYMGDRKSKAKGSDQLALQIVCKCWEKKSLRDEIYIQLCRQTTSNPKKDSLKRGWQLLTICLSIFPPSVKFQGYLEGYLWRNTEHSQLNRGVPVEVYAKFCHKRVEKITRSGAKKGLVKPTLEEIQQAKEAPFNPSPFGALLEDVIELQKEKHPDLALPSVMLELCDAILRLRGPYTQGIFRIPGDIDAVNALKVRIVRGEPVPNSCDDPHIPASLLKLWFRELDEPLIPQNY